VAEDAKTKTQTAQKGEAKRCRIKKCKRPYRAKGYCNVHYRQWRHGKHPKPRYKICTKEGCRKPRAQGGLCAEHGKPAAEGSA